MEKRVTVSLSKIRLWQKNPRIEPSSNQTAALEAIYNSGGGEQAGKRSRKQLINLAESICENGFQTEIDPLIAVESQGFYTVHDGNRRLSALLLLKFTEEYAFLEKADRKRLKLLKDDLTSPLPDEIELIVYGSAKKDQEAMREVISRKHNGPLDGVGIVPWGTKAKQRFTDKKKFSDRLEAPFEKQFEQSLSSYLGGNNAITSTQRVFEFAAVKKYLNIQDEKITPEVLDRAKEVADAVKEVAEEKGILLSRLKAADINIAISRLQGGKASPKKGSSRKTSGVSKSDNLEEALKQAKEEHLLGMKFVNEHSFVTELKEFILVNNLTRALVKFGKLTGTAEDRTLKATLLTPSVRVFFELSLKGLKNSLSDFAFIESVSKQHKKTVERVAEHFVDPRFLNFLVTQKIFDGYNQARTLITARRFGDSVEESNLASHSATQMLDEQHTEELFNDAVLFTSLSQLYVKYKSLPDSTS